MTNKITKLPSLSIFFPAYNEAGNIEESVLQALTMAQRVADQYEVIVVNDGSQDATLSVARRLARQHKNVKVVSQKNTGYGGALKKGFNTSRYEWVFFTDADLQFDITELAHFVKKAKRYQLILGYRKIRAEGWKRQVFGDLLRIWNRIFLGFPFQIKDIDCAFKLIHRSVIDQVSPLVSNGAMVSTELLLKAHLAKVKYCQIGVAHYQRSSGQPSGNEVKVILRAVLDTFHLQSRLFSHRAYQRIQAQKAMLVSALALYTK
ncbi:MAG: glycosyltransferase family 2 protein [Candidatus Pacebacteria bacterium CG_4_10_14_0_8_um_filter_43_12]|nr:MAG: glycosyltransferase family 2 protein [Candidatus Pacebacteria bacterium CG_4_10_14_0_8_um_filter_43_12]